MADDDNLLSFANTIVRTAPPWLRRLRGKALLGAIGEMLDELVNRTTDGVAARMPHVVDGANDSLPLIGSDRVMLRGPAEDDDTYADRLRTWLDAHRRRGNPYALLEQLYLYLRGTDPRPWDLVYRNGLMYAMDVDGEIVRSKIPTSLSEKWARARLFIRFDEEPTITPEQQAAWLAMPRTWSAAHVAELKVVAVWNDGVWGYPDGALWGEPPGALWGDGAIVIDDLFGEPPENTLHINGQPLVVRNRYFTLDLP